MRGLRGETQKKAKMKRIFFITTLFGVLFFHISVASAQSGTAAIHISKVTGNVGDVVDVTISLANNPGIVTMKLDVTYESSVLNLVGVTDAGKLGVAMHPTSPQELIKNPYPLSWWNPIAETDFNSNGVVATLHFEILAGADNSPITITYRPGDIRNHINTMIGFVVVNGSVTALPTEPLSLETLIVTLIASNNKITVQPQVAVANHVFYYNRSIAATPAPSQGNAINTITGATTYNSTVDIIRANGAALFVQVYKVETVSYTIVGFGEARATPNGKIGDIDGNGDVNAADLSILLANFGKTGYEITYPTADIDGNGDINAADLSILLANFGK